MRRIKTEVKPTTSLNENFSQLPDEQMMVILDGMKEYIGVHEPIFDDVGKITDCHLVKWNQAYNAVRNTAVIQGQSLMATYYDPLDALQYVNRAWQEGSCEQVFYMGHDIQDKYQYDREIVYITVVWERVGNLVLELGNDLSDFKALQLKLQSQQAAVLEAESLATLVEERERIGRDMHDSIIQQLYAAALTLRAISLAGRREDDSQQISVVADLIDETIAEIRDQIMNVNYHPIVDLRSEILEATRSLITGFNVAISVDAADDLHISSAIAPHLRSVIKEATSNAVRHGHATSIAYSCDHIDGELHLIIADNGDGFSKDFSAGNGIINMRRRAELLNGSVDVAVNTPKGTRIHWIVPFLGDDDLS
jgi:signal transduction histidine kinase